MYNNTYCYITITGGPESVIVTENPVIVTENPVIVTENPAIVTGNPVIVTENVVIVTEIPLNSLTMAAPISSNGKTQDLAQVPAHEGVAEDALGSPVGQQTVSENRQIRLTLMIPSVF